MPWRLYRLTALLVCFSLLSNLVCGAVPPALALAKNEKPILPANPVHQANPNRQAATAGPCSSADNQIFLPLIGGSAHAQSGSVQKPAADAILCGRILDANEAEKGNIVPLVGATVTHLESGQAVQTDKDGYFKLTAIPEGRQHFEFNGGTVAPLNTYGAYRSEKAMIAGTVNEITRPVYIMKLDKTGESQVNPNTITTVHNPSLNATLTIPAHVVKDGSGKDYTGPISLSKVPARFTPGSLPDTLVPGLVMTIQPMGLTFAQPAPVSFQNVDNLPPGTEVDLWSMDHKTSQFFIAGRGRVSADGKMIETIEGGIRESSWHFPMPPRVDLGATYDNNQMTETDPDCLGAISVVQPIGSTVDMASGCMHTVIELPAYRSLGAAHGLTFVYNSNRAYPQPLISFNATLSVKAAVPAKGISYELFRFGDKSGGAATYIDTSKFSESRDEPFRGVIAVDGGDLPTGIQFYQVRLTSHYANSNVSADVNGRKIVVNDRSSPFGAGWGLAGLQHLYPQPDGRLLLTDGGGNALIFDSSAMITIGGFNTARGASYGFPSGSNYVSARAALAENFSNISYSEFGEITPETLKNVDVVILGPIKEDSVVIQPLSTAESNALFDFIKTGHCAILSTEHIHFASIQSKSLVSILGMDIDGELNGYQKVTVAVPNASAVTNGPFGQVSSFMQYRTGGFSKLGPYARSLAVNPLGTALAVIDPDAIAPGSGGAVLFSDTNMFDELWKNFPYNRNLFLNSFNFCTESKRNGSSLYQGPNGDYSLITKETDGTFTRRLKDGTEYRFSASGLETALVARTGDTTTYAYDAQNRLTSITDPTGLVTSFVYGESQLQSVTDPAGRVTTYAYDANGNLLKVALPDGASQSFGYDSRHLLTTETDQRGVTRTHAYDQWGHLTGVTLPGNISRSVTYIQSVGLIDPNAGLGTSEKPAPVVRPSDAVGALVDGEGHKTLYKVGPVSYPSDITDSAGFTISITRDSNGNPLSSKLPSGGIYEGSYDGQGNLLTFTDRTVVGITQFTYEPVFNQAASITDPLGKVTTFAYDATGNLIQAKTPLGRIVNLTYGNHGLPVMLVDTLGTQTGFAYNGNGNLSQIVSGMGGEARTTSMLYTPQGYVQNLTDPLGRASSFTYDTFGRVTAETLPGVRTVAYAYDAEGNLTSVTPPGRPAHGFSYDELGDVIAYIPPAVAGSGNTQTTYAYNKAQQLTGVTRPDGQTISYAYDNAGRLTSQTQPDGVSTFGYAPSTGQLQTVSAPDGVNLTYGYAGDLLTGVTWNGPIAGAVNYHYDSKSRIDRNMVGNSAINYVYDADDSLTQAGNLSFTYDPGSGLLTGSKLGSVTDTWSYNAFAEPVSYAASFGGTALYQTAYTRDKLGRILTRNETIGGVTAAYAYSYDDAGRLVEVKKDSATVESYSYDANGNRLTALGGVTATYDDQDRLLAYGNAAYAYTANGELKSKTAGGQTTAYTYDVMGNLKAVTLPDGTQITYVVDGQNRRVGKKINGVLVQGFLYQDQLAPIAELNGNNGIVSRFVYGTHLNVPDYMIKGGVLYRFITDQLGSVRLVVNAQNGQIAQRLDYDAFGNVTQDTSLGFQPFGFAGGLYDAGTGLVRFGARDYDASVGRWTAKDGLGVVANLNLYQYAGNDPVNRIDPSGKFAFLIPILLGTALGAIVDLDIQLWKNGGKLGCVDWGSVGQSALIGGALEGVGSLLFADVEVASTISTWGRGFRPGQWLSHFEKHGAEFDYETSVDYLRGAQRLVEGGKGVQTFIRANGDTLFYRANTNEFAVVSKDGYIRTYFRPELGQDYWYEQIGR